MTQAQRGRGLQTRPHKRITMTHNLPSAKSVHAAMALLGFAHARAGMDAQSFDQSYARGFARGCGHAEKSAFTEKSASADIQNTLKQAEGLEKQSREYGTGIKRINMPDPIWKSVRVYHAIQPGKHWDHLKDVPTLREVRERNKP